MTFTKIIFWYQTTKTPKPRGCTFFSFKFIMGYQKCQKVMKKRKSDDLFFFCVWAPFFRNIYIYIAMPYLYHNREALVTLVRMVYNMRDFSVYSVSVMFCFASQTWDGMTDWSLLCHVWRAVGQIKVVIDRIFNFAWYLNLRVQSVELDIELVHVEFLFLRLELLYRISIFIHWRLVIQVLFDSLLFFFLVLLFSKKQLSESFVDLKGGYINLKF